MKKLFTLFLLGCAISANAQYQLPNGDFESEWVDCIPWNSKGNTSKVGTQPKGWTVSNVPLAGEVGKKLEETDNKAITFSNGETMGNKTPAYLTLGTSWATAYVSKIFPSAVVEKADGGTWGGQEFKFHPDAVSFRYQRDNSKGTERASAIAYLWKGTWTQADVPGNVGILSQPANATLTDRDRCVLGMDMTAGNILGGTITQTENAALIASGINYYSEATEGWTNGLIELNYGEFKNKEVEVEKINIIFAANDYFADRSTIVKGNSLSIDDVKLLYYHALETLSYEGETIEFNENTFNYDLSNTTYDEAKLAYIKKGQGATVTQAYDAQSGVLSIRVEAEDFDATDNPEAFSEYTIQFKGESSDITSDKKQYTEDLQVQLNGMTVAEQEATIDVELFENGSMNLVLKNFYFSLMGQDMYVGNIYVNDIQTVTEDDYRSFNTQQMATVTNGDDPADAPWIGEEQFADGLEINMSGKFTDNKFYCTLYLNFGMEIHVVFGKDEGFNSISSLTTDVNQTVNVYTLQGTSVKTNVKKANALDGLKKGIYIVDGKKVIKK